MRTDAYKIIEKTIADCMPERAVQNALKNLNLEGKVYVAAIGKAAWAMAVAAVDFLKDRVEKGVIVTKYAHAKGRPDRFEIVEAGHPTPDDNSVLGAQKVINLLEQAGGEDTVLFLLSGGGSSLVEAPAEGLSLSDIREMTKQLLFCGAGITEMNVIRKKLSAIKGGKLMGHIHGAKAYAIILSDIIGEHEDMIASGLTYPDTSTAEDARQILERYKLKTDEKIEKVLSDSKPWETVCVENHVVGSVAELCQAAARHAKELGYEPHILTASLQCEAKEAGRWITSKENRNYDGSFAVIAGGETVVKVTGNGKGGRNQELALSAARELEGEKGVLLFSLGSDGTDGPTDAAGGIVDGETISKLEEMGIDVEEALLNNDSYHALEKVDGLIVTGPTGTNVNDVTVLLCRGNHAIN